MQASVTSPGFVLLLAWHRAEYSNARLPKNMHVGWQWIFCFRWEAHDHDTPAAQELNDAVVTLRLLVRKILTLHDIFKDLVLYFFSYVPNEAIVVLLINLGWVGKHSDFNCESQRRRIFYLADPETRPWSQLRQNLKNKDITSMHFAEVKV